MKTITIILTCIILQTSVSIFGQKYKELRPTVEAIEKMKSFEYTEISKIGIPFDTINYRYYHSNLKCLILPDKLPWIYSKSKESELYFNGEIRWILDHERKVATIDSIENPYFFELSASIGPEFKTVEALFNFIDSTKYKVKFKSQMIDKQFKYIEIEMPELDDWFISNNKPLYVEILPDITFHVIYRITIDTKTNLPVKVIHISKDQMSISEIKDIKLNHLSKADFIPPVPPLDYKIDNTFEAVRNLLKTKGK